MRTSCTPITKEGQLQRRATRILASYFTSSAVQQLKVLLIYLGVHTVSILAYLISSNRIGKSQHINHDDTRQITQDRCLFSSYVY